MIDSIEQRTVATVTRHRHDDYCETCDTKMI